MPHDKEHQTTVTAAGDIEFAPININGDDDDDEDVGVAAVPERGAWNSKWQFMMSCVSLSVGLGNVWRFPYLVQKNGGGAFMIPYLIMMVVEGAPIFLLELGIGQRLRQGSLGVWNDIHPWSAGIGVTSTITSFVVGLYYNVVVCWCFYYLFNSFSSPLPFSECPQLNGTRVPECTSETSYFWYRTAQQSSASIDVLNGINWKMALCLLLAWLLVYFCIMKGIQSSGKVMYFTAIFPYTILLAFFCKAVTLEGAGQGLRRLFTPNMSMLMDTMVWMDAATQVFYSLGLGFGSLIAFASYNPIKNNCKQDALFMCCVTVFTATFAAVDIFAVLGHKAVIQERFCVKKILCDNFPQDVFCNQTVEEFKQHIDKFPIDNATHENLHTRTRCQVNIKEVEGTGLAFIAFTEAIVLLPGSQFWSIAFFMMLLALGLGSQFGTMEGVITNLFDMNIKIRKEILTGIVCGVSYLIGLLFTTGAGSYWVGLFDAYAGTFGLVIVGFFELVVISYVYGHKKFTDDVEYMTGSRPGVYWQIMWRLVAPVFIFVIFVGTIYKLATQPQEYPVWNPEKGQEERVVYPGAVMGFGVFLMVLGAVPIPLVFLMRRFQCLRFDPNIHQASMKRVDTTISTAGMVNDDEVETSGESADNSEENISEVRFRMEVLET